MIYVLESMKLSRQRMDSAYQAANSRRSQHTSFWRVSADRLSLL